MCLGLVMEGVIGLDYHKQWYPMGIERFMSKKEVHHVDIMDNPIAVWHDGEEWRAVKDECPHRKVPLSEGRVDEKGCVECPYHGWSFEGAQGKCTKIPQATDDSDFVDRVKVDHHATFLDQGLIW